LKKEWSIIEEEKNTIIDKERKVLKIIKLWMNRLKKKEEKQV